MGTSREEIKKQNNKLYFYIVNILYKAIKNMEEKK